jgi:hypothetical protein
MEVSIAWGESVHSHCRSCLSTCLPPTASHTPTVYCCCTIVQGFAHQRLQQGCRFRVASPLLHGLPACWLSAKPLVRRTPTTQGTEGLVQTTTSNSTHREATSNCNGCTSTDRPPPTARPRHMLRKHWLRCSASVHQAGGASLLIDGSFAGAVANLPASTVRCSITVELGMPRAWSGTARAI